MWIAFDLMFSCMDDFARTGDGDVCHTVTQTYGATVKKVVATACRNRVADIVKRVPTGGGKQADHGSRPICASEHGIKMRGLFK